MASPTPAVWHRPYAPGRGRRLIILWELVSLAAFGWTTVRLFDLSSTGAAVVAAVLAAVWVLGAWQITRIGVYLSGQGVRIRGLVRVRTLRWAEIETFRVLRVTHKIGRFELPAGTTVVIERHDGRVVNTALWADGVDFHARPGVFGDVLRRLREQHYAAVAAQC